MNWLRRLFTPAPQLRLSTPRGTRLTLEALEDRQVPTTFVVAEVPGEGVLRWSSNTNSWQQLTTWNASHVAIDSAGDVAAEFPNQGVWRYEDATGWQQLTGSNVTQVAIANGNVAVENPGYGVWRYEDAKGWQNLTTWDASHIGIDAYGDVAAAFPNQGVWRYEDATGWQQLTASNVSQLAMAPNGYVVVENPGYGVWRYEDATGWKLLTGLDAGQVSIDSAGDVVGSFQFHGVFQSPGLMLFTDARGWKQITSGDPATRPGSLGFGDDGVVVTVNPPVSGNPAGIYLYKYEWLTSIIGPGAPFTEYGLHHEAISNFDPIAIGVGAQ
jgi:hypothetical protein